MKILSGKFKEPIDKRTYIFNSSLAFDKRLYKHDILGSVAHATMLGECGILLKNEADLLCKTLMSIYKDMCEGRLTATDGEDIHMFIEAELTARIGDIGKKLHTARSRNDQVALDLRLYLRDTADEIRAHIKLLIETIMNIAEQNVDTIIPAYTHMQKAQPSTLAHHYMAYTEMFLRDAERLADCRKRINVMPLGACALCGTSYPINRERVAELLDFSAVSQNSMDAVSDRDFAVEFLSTTALIMTHLSRFNEEIIYWATEEFGYIELSDRFSTGSSIMPQKKNPDVSELIRGKTGRCYGHLIGLLTATKGLPLAYNKDMQEDKEAIFDAVDTLKDCLSIFTAMLPELKFNTARLLKNAGGGYTAATECADYLTKKGLPFRDAHATVKELVLWCQDNALLLDALKLADFKRFSPAFEADILEIVKIQNVIAAHETIGGPAPKAVRAHMKKVRTILAKEF